MAVLDNTMIGYDDIQSVTAKVLIICLFVFLNNLKLTFLFIYSF